MKKVTGIHQEKVTQMKNVCQCFKILTPCLTYADLISIVLLINLQ